MTTEEAMNILLLEWACAGGSGGRPLLPEGFGMLRTLCSCLRAQGHRVTATVSKRLAREAAYLGADDLILIEDDPSRAAGELFPEFEGVFLVAPESHGTLSRISHMATSSSTILSCPPKTVDAFSSKLASFELISKHARNLKVPEFELVQADAREIASSADRVGLPAVVKPPDGAGSEGTSILRTVSDSKAACARLAASGWKHGLIQRFVQGRHLSATFIAQRTDILPLSINAQFIAISQTLRYQGGSCPYPLPCAEAIWDDVANVVRAAGSEGLMGMDFVYDGQCCYFMEINPRMTTSCIGISKIIEPPLGQLITTRSGVRSRHRAYAQWAILPIQRTVPSSETVLSKVFDIPAVVSPPFSAGQYYMKDLSRILVCVSGKDPLEMPARIDETRRRLSEVGLIC